MFKKPMLAAALVALAYVLAAPAAKATNLPPGFSEVTVVPSLAAPTAFAFAPDGRIFICQQGGQLRVYDANGTFLATAVTVSVTGAFERGLLGITFDPDFATNQYIYLYYSTNSGSLNPPPTPKNRVSRFTMNGNMVVPGSETILVDLIPSDAGNHNAGQLRFGSDGKLYASTGDGGSTPNNGQNLTNLAGKILRINKDGSIPSDNPFFNSPTPGIRKEIWAYGFRNPWRFTFQPDTDAMFVADVGQNLWEEVDIAVPGGNFGWPIMEGFHCYNADTCNMTGLTLPIHEYSHGGSGASITGGAFYQGDTYPTEFGGSYFYADYVDAFIRRLVLDENNVVIADEPFATNAPSPVSFEYHDDSIWFITYNGTNGTLRRINYTGGANRSPVAEASADKNAGLLPLTVNFSSAGTFDPDNHALSYLWNFGDGMTSTAANPSHTYTGSPRTVNATLTVTDNGSPNLMDTSPPIRIVLGDQPPVATITGPADNSTYTAGQTINFGGTGTDPEDGTRPASAFTWRVLFHHNTHTHPFLGPITGVTSGSFVIPNRGESATDVWYEIILTVADSQGVTATDSHRINPVVSSITLNTVPAGADLTLDGTTVTAPITVGSVAGFLHDVDIPLPQVVNGTTYSTFGGWSDGGARAHTITTPASPATYTAVLVADSAPSRTPHGGDWDGNGVGTIGLYFRQTGTFALRNTNTPGAADFFFGYGPANPGWIALTGDWDGNGTRTPGLFDPATSTFFLRNSNSPGGANLVFGFGAPGNGWTPLSGDWDGDGDDTIGLYDPVTGAFFLKNSNVGGGADLVFTYGPTGAGVVPLVGDWDGNGSTTVGIYLSSSAGFFLKNSNAPGAADIVFSFGASGLGFVPVAGNWDGSGGESIGLYDLANGAFFLKNANAGGGADFVFTFGPTGP